MNELLLGFLAEFVLFGFIFTWINIRFIKKDCNKIYELQSKITSMEYQYQKLEREIGYLKKDYLK